MAVISHNDQKCVFPAFKLKWIIIHIYSMEHWNTLSAYTEEQVSFRGMTLLYSSLVASEAHRGIGVR